MSEPLPAVPGNLDTLTAVTAEIDAMIRVWRTGTNSRFQAVFDSFFGADPFRGYRRGGRLTWHELMFARWFPELQQQVTFGTGKGGRAAWGAPSFTADFFDEEERVVWEIDGPSHRGAIRQDRDTRKDRFFESVGITVKRLPNSAIEGWARDALLHVAECNLGLRPTLDGVDRLRYEALRPLVQAWAKEHREVVG